MQLCTVSNVSHVMGATSRCDWLMNYCSAERRYAVSRRRNARRRWIPLYLFFTWMWSMLLVVHSIGWCLGWISFPDFHSVRVHSVNLFSDLARCFISFASTVCGFVVLLPLPLADDMRGNTISLFLNSFEYYIGGLRSGFAKCNNLSYYTFTDDDGCFFINVSMSLVFQWPISSPHLPHSGFSHWNQSRLW